MVDDRLGRAAPPVGGDPPAGPPLPRDRKADEPPAIELAGRDPELEATARAARDVALGTSRTLSVVGEAGIGKSALLAALAHQARSRGLLVLEGRAAEHEREVPFALAVHAFDDHVATLHPRRVMSLGPDLSVVLPAAAVVGDSPPSVGEDAAGRLRLHRALRALVELLGRERPVALVLDDLHWADDASIELVLHLLRRPPRAPFLLAVAFRPAELSARLIDAARAAPAWEHLALQPLDEPASLRLLDGLSDTELRARVLREAGGNPLFLRELERVARVPAGPLPSTLMAAVRQEVTALAPGARALIEGAAVAGDPFDPELAAAACELAPAAASVPLDELVAADFVRPTAEGRAFAFRHPVVRRAVYDGSPPAWRLAAHERVAAALSERRAPAVVRAYHVERFARVGDESGLSVLVEAAAASADRAPAAAAHWYRVAARLLPAGDDGRRAAILERMALALRSAGRLEESREALVETLGLFPGRSPAARVALVCACAQVEHVIGRSADARRRLLTALVDAPPQSRAAVALELAAGALWAGRLGELREWSERAEHLARGHDPAMLTEAEALRAIGADRRADPEGALDLLDRAGARYEALEDAAIAARPSVAVHLGGAQLFGERYAVAASTATRALRAARDAGHDQLVALLLTSRARARANLLELDGALEDAEASEGTARLQGVDNLLRLALLERASIHHQRGETVEAERAAEACRALIGVLEPTDVIRVNLCQLAALGAERDPGAFVEQVLATTGSLLDHEGSVWPSSLMLDLVRAGVASARLQEASAWADWMADHAARLRLPVSAVRADCARAEVLLARGEPSQAATRAEAAVAAAERAGALRDAVESRLLLGRAAAAAGESERAKTALRRVADDAARGGALRLRDAAAHVLRGLGGRVPARGHRAPGSSGVDGLTERERTIVELVVRAYTNKQVGAALHLSEKTVENALTRIFAKVGVRSRVELTRLLTHV